MVVFLVEGALRPGYHPASEFISALSLGPRGAVQIASFLITGASLVTFSRAVRVVLSEGIASRAGPTLLFLVGAGLFISGPMVMDPSGTPLSQSTVHGVFHALCGALVFSLSPVSCFVFWRRFVREPPWRGFGHVTLVTGCWVTLAVLALRFATPHPPAAASVLTPWAGWIQRAAIGPYLLWVAGFAARLLRMRTRRAPPVTA